MSVLSIYSCNNSIEAGFELVGYDITHRTDNAIGVIGDHIKKVRKAVKALQPLFFVITPHKNKAIDIDGYTTTLHFTTPEVYECSRPITWIIGVKDNTNISIPVLFPEADLLDESLTIDDPDTILAINIATAITDAIDDNAIMDEYDRYYGFSPFESYLP